MTHCCECYFQYRLVRNPEFAELRQVQREHCCAVCRWLMKRSFLGFVLVQSVLCLLALALRGLDQDEKLIQWFNLPHPTGAPSPGEGDYWTTLRFYKSTYYLAAILLVLVLLGVITLVGMYRDRQRCCATICPEQNQEQCMRCSMFTGFFCAESLQTVACAAYDILGGIGLVIILVAFVGLFAALAGLALAVQSVWQRCLEVRERQLIAAEYIVEDLSRSSDPPASGGDAEERTEEVAQDRMQHELARDLSIV